MVLGCNASRDVVDRYIKPRPVHPPSAIEVSPQMFKFPTFKICINMCYVHQSPCSNIKIRQELHYVCFWPKRRLQLCVLLCSLFLKYPRNLVCLILAQNIQLVLTGEPVFGLKWHAVEAFTYISKNANSSPHVCIFSTKMNRGWLMCLSPLFLSYICRSSICFLLAQILT